MSIFVLVFLGPFHQLARVCHFSSACSMYEQSNNVGSTGNSKNGDGGNGGQYCNKVQPSLLQLVTAV